MSLIKQEQELPRIGAAAQIKCETAYDHIPDEKPKPKAEPKRELQGREVAFAKPEPWPQPVDGNEVLHNVAEAIQRHMSIRVIDTYVVALWCAHTHVFEVFNHTPRLAITAPQPECGKSVLLPGLIANLVSRPLEADNITPAPFFRLAASHQPTFLIDEVDSWLKEDSQLPSALNNGWQQNGRTIRCVGDGQEVRSFSTHAPVAMAGIRLHKKLQPATQTRCISVELARALPGEVEEYFDQRKHTTSLKMLCRKLARWMEDNSQKLKSCDPSLPPNVLNREADLWRPLFAIAEIAGGSWPELVKQALLSQEGTNTQTKELQLLTDINKVLAQGVYAPGIFTDELISELCELDESLWVEYNFRAYPAEKKRIKPKQLAGLLKDFKCEPHTIRRSEIRRKGYYTNDLRAVIRRYLPDEGDSQA